MREIDRALADISSIRAQLATTIQFRGFTPNMLVVTACLFITITLAQMMLPHWLAPDDRSLVFSWGGILVLTTFAGAAEAMIRSRRQHGGMAGPMWRSAMHVVGPIWATGTIIAVNVAMHAPGEIWIVPGIWMLLIGLVGFAFQGTMPRGVFWVALLYMGLGTVMLSIAGNSGHLTPGLIGIPLVLGNLAMAFVLHNQETRH